MDNDQTKAIELARAKLNLRLKFEGRRQDGYHLLSMVNCTLTLADSITVTRVSEGISLVVSGDPDPQLIDPKINFAAIAAKNFLSTCGLSSGVEIHIEKRVPTGTGLGGGSSDASATLRALARLFPLEFARHCKNARLSPPRALEALALHVGADAPFFVEGGAARVTGVGEEVCPLDMRRFDDHRVFLCLPEVRISTKEFYAFIREASPNLPTSMDQSGRSLASGCALEDSSTLFSLIANDFESYLPDFCPVVASALVAVRGAGYRAGLTGSGSAFFAFLQPQAGTAAGLVELGKRHSFAILETQLSCARSRIAFCGNPL